MLWHTRYRLSATRMMRSCRQGCKMSRRQDRGVMHHCRKLTTQSVHNDKINQRR
ncbi:hypothetical protein KSS87_015512 [Heliosperma pusillum]|nr:hypothetical protein KSS87_015512 [Heliosperma pusillum]